ncbi:MAG: aminoacyl-tRNA hydrolase [Anaeroplasmataceae bacterium]|nr:aminoacyl-tRNA hydrolase [Anaeroplasmataceae bacterium]MDE5868226.1 aminoacyl-tRNA hydrolase [Anaeroplasmataceae bacterium]
MKLVVGLGNPDERYHQTRHNVGFMAIDFFASKYQTEFRLAPQFKGMLASINIDGHKALLLKPMTYMNLSGESVSAVMRYYKINIEDVLIISDDLDSKTGRVRVRANGSAGGHNGHKNIMVHLGTSEYKRIKIGIDRSPIIPVIDWVLQRFSEDEMVQINQAIEKTSKAIFDFIQEVPFQKIASLYSNKA